MEGSGLDKDGCKVAVRWLQGCSKVAPRLLQGGCKGCIR